MDIDHNCTWLARRMAYIHGAALVGRYVVTERVGDWPGGLARVTEWMPDPEEGIVLMVQQGDGDPMGIFGDEAIILIPDGFRLPDGI